MLFCESSSASPNPLTDLITPALLMFIKISDKLESVAKPNSAIRLTKPYVSTTFCMGLSKRSIPSPVAVL